MRLFISLFVFVFSTGAFAGPVPFSKIKEFHDDRTEVIKKNYGLEEVVDVSVMISPKEMKSLNIFEEKKQIKLPGLLLGGIEIERDPATIGMFEVITDLENYKRDITIVKKRKVSEEEIQAMILSLKENLLLRPDESVRVEDKTFNFSEAMKNWREDMKEAFYEGTFKSSMWAWIPVSLLLLCFISLAFSWALKSGFKTLGKSIENVDLSGDSSGGANFSSGSSIGDDGEFEEEMVVTADSLYEADPIRSYQKFISLFLKSKYELYKILWSSLPTPGLQISFYETMSQGLTDDEEKEFKSVYFDIFKIDSSALIHGGKAEEVSSEILNQINKSISMAEMSEPVLMRERALAAIYPEYGKSVQQIVENSVESFFTVVFYLFPDVVVQVVKNSPNLSEVISKKLPEFLSRPSADRIPDNKTIQDFASFIESNDGFAKDNLETDIGEYAMKLLSSLPDSEIFNSSFLNTGNLNALKTLIPSVQWINTDDLQVLRKFLIQLSPEELGYLKQEHFNFQGLIEELDERALMRINEGVDRSFRIKRKVNIALLRKKIAASFKPKNEENESFEDDLFNAA